MLIGWGDVVTRQVKSLDTLPPSAIEYCQKGGGFDRAGEDIVIGFIDSGIYPHHTSFASHNTEPYGPLPKYGGTCEIDPSTKKDYCNGKIIGAQHFSEAAKAAGSFNPAMDFDSPLDGDGHGRFEQIQLPDVVVNCAALSFPRACEVDPTAAMAINVPFVLVKWLSSFSNGGSLLIHLSTDQGLLGVKSCKAEYASPQLFAMLRFYWLPGGQFFPHLTYCFNVALEPLPRSPLI
ncbi:hypothetical protein FXO37_17590 [Capsicum annuum]|nr:hypothetical protein FXO37_17590 [Capsicum annuum]